MSALEQIEADFQWLARTANAAGDTQHRAALGGLTVIEELRAAWKREAQTGILRYTEDLDALCPLCGRPGQTSGRVSVEFADHVPLGVAPIVGALTQYVNEITFDPCGHRMVSDMHVDSGAWHLDDADVAARLGTESDAVSQSSVG